MIRVTDIRRGSVDTSGAVRVDEETYMLFSKKHRPQIGDILFSRVGSYGNSAFVNRNEEFCLGQNTVCITPEKSRIHPTFLYCALNSEDLRNQIESLVGGASQGTISLKNIRKLQVPIPPLPIQQRIASILSAYDELIENNLRRIKILETIARNLYREWFVHFRFPGHENHPRVGSPLGEIPQGWEYRELSELGFVGRGRSRHRPRNEQLLYGGPYPFFQTGNIKEARVFLRTHSQTYSDIGLAQSKLWQPGTLCITIAANIAETAILAKTACFPDSVVGFVPDIKISDAFYVKLYLDSIKHQMQNVSRGTTQDNLSLEKLLSFQILTPPPAIILAFRENVSPMLEQLNLLLQKEENLRQTRDLLLPRLLSGQITLPEAADDLTQVTSHA